MHPREKITAGEYLWSSKGYGADVLEAQGLSKRYGDTVAVRGVDLQIHAGEAFGLLGPNGAGKTTTIHLLIGALDPDAGTVMLDGQSDTKRPDLRRILGIAPQELALYDELSAEENLAFFARIYGLHSQKLRQRIDWGLEFAGLTERRRDRVETYSSGMKRRLNLACAAVHEPRVLLCDEPTVGVDPQSRNHIFASIEQLKAKGCTLLYTTHYMEEAERLCDRVAIMDKGKILALGTVDELVAEYGGAAVVEAELAEIPDWAETLPGTLDGHTLRMESDDPLQAVADLGARGIRLHQLRIDKPDLERVFLRLTGRTLRD